MESLEPVSPEEPLVQFDMRRYFDALRRFAWAIIALIAIAVTGSVIYTNRLPRIYEAKASVQIEPRLPDLLGQGADSLNGNGAGNTADYYKQQRQVLSSYTLISATVEQHQLYLKLLSDKDRDGKKVPEQVDLTTRKLQKLLEVKYPDTDRIMYVIVRNEDKQLAADIANWHVLTYIDYSRNLLTLGTDQASSALQGEFDKAETNLRDAEKELYQFQKDKELLGVSLEDRLNLVSSNISSYTAKTNDARGKRIELGARLDRMRKAAALDVLESPILMMSEGSSFDTLRAQYYAERNKFLELEKEVGPKNTEYQKQKAKIEDLLSALQSEAKRMVGGVSEQYEAMFATERALSAEVDKYKKEALDLGPNIVGYNELFRKKKSLEDRYTILRNRLSTADMTGRMNKSNDTAYAKPLDRALVPTEPVSPNLRVNVVAAGTASLFLGIGLVLLIVFLDRSIKSTADAENSAGIPVLGVIPILAQSLLPRDDNKARDLYVHTNPKSQIAEQCRSLRTNILFSAADRELKTIMVTSANEKEGKTTSVIYLGTTMAQQFQQQGHEQRVLLIDTDMRKPRLHESMGVSNRSGLSNLILGDQAYEAVIKTTDIPNLYLLPCGPKPPAPAELLMGKKFQHVLAELSKRFDLIILDSPPVHPVTDAVVLSKQVDGVIFVARSGKTLRDELKRATKQIRDVGGALLGTIVNEFDVSGSGYYSYYGYGETGETAPASSST